MNTRTKISRELAAQYGQEAIAIIDSGEYRTTTGKLIRISYLIDTSVKGTKSFPPDQNLPQPSQGEHDTRIEVRNETTLAAAKRLLDAGLNPVALNFASAVAPGGGFLTGARAQEEYLVRSSGLFACIRDDPMYAYHRANHDPIYSDHAIYSPQVPVFRSDDGSLLEEPYTVGIITSAAVNAVALKSSRHSEIGPAMRSRTRRVLTIGVMHGHDSIVLGAWGCGAFGNDGHQIAGLFRAALHQDFAGAYRHVIFAILDRSPEQRFVRPFQKAFAVGARQ